MARLIVFLVRLKLGVKNKQYFRFTNQRTDAVYMFSGGRLWKKWVVDGWSLSGVSLNWLMDPECKIEKVGV